MILYLVFSNKIWLVGYWIFLIFFLLFVLNVNKIFGKENNMFRLKIWVGNCLKKYGLCFLLVFLKDFEIGCW